MTDPMTTPPRDPRPRSRACGVTAHDHGPACSVDCPTCVEGAAYVHVETPTRDTTEAEALAENITKHHGDAFFATQRAERAAAAERSLVERIERFYAAEHARLTTEDCPEPTKVPMLGNYLGGIAAAANELRTALAAVRPDTEGER